MPKRKVEEEIKEVPKEQKQEIENNEDDEQEEVFPYELSMINTRKGNRSFWGS